MKDKYYALVDDDKTFECDVLEEAILEDPYLIIKGRIVFSQDKTKKLEDFIDKKKLLTASEVQKIFNVSRQTIWSWEKAGRLPEPIRFMRNKYWNRAEIMKLAQKEGIK